MQKKTSMTFYVDNIEINITIETSGLRVKTCYDTLLLANQTIEETRLIIEKNYAIVKDHYIKLSDNKIDQNDISIVCMKIVLYYFYMYNLWRTMYKKEKNRDLTFLNKDYEHPYTHDRIIEYFKEKYPNNYFEKCEILLQMTKGEVLSYVKNRKDFYEMF